ncbi:hypothetical protein N7501_009415 [Penicillium viridicatum]|nr:hypothetical protein N7501_009415 [Penicillium viridicatum]
MAPSLSRVKQEQLRKRRNNLLRRHNDFWRLYSIQASRADREVENLVTSMYLGYFQLLGLLGAYENCQHEQV